MINDVYALTDNAVLLRIGKSIRNQRLNRNVSQKELAKTAGISTSSVAAIERGKSVSLQTLVSVLRALNSLHLLYEFLKEPEISPIAYSKLLEKQKSRKRASISKNNNVKVESEW